MTAVASGGVTVSCAASVDEMREANRWLFTHDRAYFGRIFGTIVVPALILCGGVFLLMHSASPSARAASVLILVVAAVRLLSGLQLVVGMFTMAPRTFARVQREGPTILTVSAAGLQWEDQTKQMHLPWGQIAGYATLPHVLVFVANPPFIVPRSTVGAFDFARIVSLAQTYSKPGSYFSLYSLQPALSTPKSTTTP
jgi:hypothetical protein